MVWAIPQPPGGKKLDTELTAVQFTVNGAKEPPLPRVENAASCAEHEAWYYDVPSAPTRVFACPTMCGRVQGASDAQVAVLLDCAPPIIRVK